MLGILRGRRWGSVKYLFRSGGGGSGLIFSTVEGEVVMEMYAEEGVVLDIVYVFTSRFKIKHNYFPPGGPTPTSGTTLPQCGFHTHPSHPSPRACIVMTKYDVVL